MSLVIAIKGPEGIVLAADTRVTLTSGADSREAHFDNSSKLLTVGGSHNRVAAVAYGAGSVSGRMVSGLMSEFQTDNRRCTAFHIEIREAVFTVFRSAMESRRQHIQYLVPSRRC